MRTRIIVMCLFLLVYACSTQEEQISANAESSELEVSFDINAGINISEDEMKGGGKLFNDNDLIGLQIIKKAGTANEIVASGLFTGSTINEKSTELKIVLDASYSYSVEAICIVNGVNVVEQSNGQYGQPFVGKTAISTLDNWTKLQNSDLEVFSGLCNISEDSQSGLCSYESLYFTGDISVNIENPVVKIDLKRTSVKFVPVVYNISKNCYVEGKIFSGSKSAEDMELNFPDKAGTKLFQSDCSEKEELIFGEESIVNYYTAEQVYSISSSSGLQAVYDVAINGRDSENILDAYNMEFYVKDKTTNNVIRTLTATVQPLPNKKYYLLVNASVDADYGINVSFSADFDAESGVVAEDVSF